ncbi:MAG: DEAD/DEAH box helicase family protein [Deltaproteobacteria bacterium]|jgi:predicted helicase|nr:DEAD/DEAH box helicase family protein [Deltaproteobacteria bacterium]
MINFLKTYPLYDKYNFKFVWLWKEYPYHDSNDRPDTGVDIIALTEEGDYWAVQCKFVGPNDYVNSDGINSFFRASGQLIKTERGERKFFSYRLLISTSYRWSSTAENSLENQSIECFKLSLLDLEKASVDWLKLDQGLFGREARLKQYALKDHQKAALEAARNHYQSHDRGSLIMACGTGKTYASLKIVEDLTKSKGLVIFFAPSIALVGQTLKEWTAQASETSALYPLCVCSDKSVSKYKKDDNDIDSTSIADLSVPVTTNTKAILKELKKEKYKDRLEVIFSTYQSIEPLAEALCQYGREVDLIVYDEAHRTTGAKLPNLEKAQGYDESYFVKVHDNNFIKASKRLYMTATPRVYHENAKDKAKSLGGSIILFSMDDADHYGEEFYHLGFGEAVAKDLLSDYKVLVLTINRQSFSEAQQEKLADGKKEITSDDLTKLLGCHNALSKNFAYEGKVLRDVDPGPMRKAVTFCQSITKSKLISEAFNNLN